MARGTSHQLRQFIQTGPRAGALRVNCHYQGQLIGAARKTQARGPLAGRFLSEGGRRHLISDQTVHSDDDGEAPGQCHGRSGQYSGPASLHHLQQIRHKPRAVLRFPPIFSVNRIASVSHITIRTKAGWAFRSMVRRRAGKLYPNKKVLYTRP